MHGAFGDPYSPASGRSAGHLSVLSTPSAPSWQVVVAVVRSPVA